MMHDTHLDRPRLERMVAVMTLAIVATGCQMPWRPHTAATPDFDQLIELEQHQNQAASRPGVSHSTARPTTEQNAAGTVASHEADASDHEAASSRKHAAPEEQLLERISRAIHHATQEGADEQLETPATTAAASRPAEGEEPPQGSDVEPAVFHLSDDDPAPVPAAATEPARETNGPAPKQRRNRYLEEAGHATQETSSPNRPADDVAPASASQPLESEEISHRAMRVPSTEASEKPAEQELDRTAVLRSASIRELALVLAEKLDAAAGSAMDPDEQIDLAKKRRLVNLAIDDLNGAMEPIEGLQPQAQDYLANTFQALFDATDLNGNPVANRRWTLALRSHRQAARSLSQLANLEISNIAFCTEVLSFGVITRFPQYHFRPDQEVLLYCELKNFVSQPVRGGYETQLQGSYEIVDDQGRRVADQILPEDTDFCANMREDFYIAYRFHLPSNLEPGRHELRLTIEDMKGHKFGQGKIDFHVIR